ncbi:MAG: AAA family ATPase [Bdellovibrionales bacterium]|nr:AAA family ATPase [Bdellovibrionales bacterium]
MNYSPQKVLKMFALEDNPHFSIDILHKAIALGKIPNFPKSRGLRKKSWSANEIPLIGEHFGFLKKPKRPIVICVFVTKGGVLKSSLTLNLARVAALHNIKTCVVGLDMQGDITSALGLNRDLDNEDDFETALNKISAIRGLPDLFNDQAQIFDLIENTDLPSLDFIPETPELVNLEKSLALTNRREYWLKNYVIEPLKEKYDLILLDASPNWNLLITNALAACDVLVSPLECKINNFRNFKMFDSFIREFKWDMNLNFAHHYVPTRWQKQRKLSVEILNWYRENLDNCSQFSIPESGQGEESSAMSLSVPEYTPGHPLAIMYNQLIREIFTLMQAQKLKEQNIEYRIRDTKKEVESDIES